MKKLLLSLGAISVGAALITPKIIASNVQTNINTIVEQVNALPGYNASVSELHSAWFDTNAKVLVSFDMAGLGADLPAEASEKFENLAVEIAVNASHGPILMAGEHSFGLANISIAVANEELRKHINWANNLPLYGVESHIDIFGNTSYTDNIQAFTVVEQEEGVDINFAGYQGSGAFENGEWQYTGQSNNTIIKTENGDVVIGAMDVDMTVASSFIDMMKSGFYDSDSSFTIRSINFEDDNSENKVLANNIYIKANSKINTEKNTGDIGITYGLDSLTTADFKAEDVALAIEINNISQAFIEAYQQNVNELSVGTEAEIQAKLLQFAETHLLSLLKAEPEMNVTSLRGTLAQGTFDSSINTRLAGIDALPDLLTDVQFWLSHALANGQLRGDKAVIEYLAAKVMESQLKQNPQTAEMSAEEIEQIAMQQAPQFLQNFVQQGLLVSNDKQYSTTFALKDKALTINDKPIPLPL